MVGWKRHPWDLWRTYRLHERHQLLIPDMDLHCSAVFQWCVFKLDMFVFFQCALQKQPQQVLDTNHGRWRVLFWSLQMENPNIYMFFKRRHPCWCEWMLVLCLGGRAIGLRQPHYCKLCCWLVSVSWNCGIWKIHRVQNGTTRWWFHFFHPYLGEISSLTSIFFK